MMEIGEYCPVHNTRLNPKKKKKKTQKKEKEKRKKEKKKRSVVERREQRTQEISYHNHSLKEGYPKSHPLIVSQTSTP